MRYERAPSPAPGLADAGDQVARLRQVLALVEELAGGPAGGRDAFDQAARISDFYSRALPIDQRRFDVAAADTARWSAAGVEALLRIEEQGRPCRAAARTLADRLSRALGELARIVGA